MHSWLVVKMDQGLYLFDRTINRQLLAMGIDTERARSSIRFSLGCATTGADVDAALDIVPNAVQRLVGAAA